MKLFRVLTLTTMLVGLLSLSLVAEDVAKKGNETIELKNQTNCPVMGGKIDSTAFTDIQGQRVYHCCPGCTKALTEDPDKYFKKAAEEGILFENIQTTCPVSGEELKEKSSFVDHEGRRVYFCCDDCKEPFAKEPAKYLKALDDTKENAPKKGTAHDMGAHGGY